MIAHGDSLTVDDVMTIKCHDWDWTPVEIEKPKPDPRRSRITSRGGRSDDWKGKRYVHR